MSHDTPVSLKYLLTVQMIYKSLLGHSSTQDDSHISVESFFSPGKTLGLFNVSDKMDFYTSP